MTDRHAEPLVRALLTSNIEPAAIDFARQLLSPDEQARADRFHFDRDRIDFILAHALLRRTLSEVGPLGASGWTFVAGENGKPMLAPGTPGPSLEFNLSHTRGFVACVVATHGLVGIDVEQISRNTDWRAIATRYFSTAEVAALEQTPESDQRVRFVELWTLKEAFAKALGLGLAQPLNETTFDISGEGSIAFQPPPGIDAGAWTFALSAPAPDYRLAVAMRG